jgi:hypothetical protein
MCTLFVSANAIADFGPISGDPAGPTARWSANDGRTSFRFDQDLLQELQISVIGPERDASSNMPGELEFRIQNDSGLDMWMPQAAWDGFAAGKLEHSEPFSLVWPDGQLELDGFSLVPVTGDALELVDKAGNSLFRLDYIHVMVYPEEETMTLWNMDMSLTPWLADRMGYSDLAGMVLASAFTRTSVDIPIGAVTQGSCDRPVWHNGTTALNDVELSNLGSVQQVAREAGVRVAIAPSATLRNVGTADVPWYQKFTTVPPQTFDDYPDPYSRDQHPFLVWAMYMFIDDIPQQIGQSAVKHAFFTVNGSCSCPGGHILWSAASAPNGQGCTDTYGVGTNDSPPSLGLRENIPAFTGEFEQCGGSIFAPGATPPGPCAQEHSGSTPDSFERRLVVAESQLETENASFFFEGWYVIRDDIDIFNTMAYKSVTPTFGSTWTFPSGVHTIGPAINAWVAPNTRGNNEAHTVEVTDHGHYSVAVKVSNLGGGQYRYVYALMNYDFDPRFNSFALSVPGDITISNIDFLDGDTDNANDWTSSNMGGQLSWTAPGGAAVEWGHMVTFVFEADTAPVQSAVELTADELPLNYSPITLGLDPGLDFNHGFEN